MIGERLKAWTARRRPARRPRALLAWEYGSGHTHTANLLAVARRLREVGFECLATLQDPRAGRAFAALAIPTVQGWLWPHSRRFARHDRERPYAGFVDLLGNLGLGEADAVEAALVHYDGLFWLFDPDLVLAENAPGAHLAARGRCPTLAFGFGQFLPPVVDSRLPSSGAPASWAEDEILSGLDEGLRRAGRPPLPALAELFRTEAAIPFGPAAFDLHTPLRTVPALPAHVAGFEPGMRAASGTEVFVYLHGFAVRLPAVLAALVCLRRPVRAHVPDLDPDDRALLAQSGAILEDDPLPVGRIVARSRCLVHHGGVGLTAAGLSAGLPQVILSRQLDNRIAGEFVARDGLGAHRWLWEATTAWIVAAARRACDDADLSARCLARAPEFDGWFGPDPTAQVAAEACRLLNVPAGLTG